MQQNTKQWLDLRKNYIGASDAPVIMGVSPWKTKYELWQEKLGLISNDKPYLNKYLDLEIEARNEFIKKTGIFVHPDVIFSDKYPWMMASLDGLSQCKQFIVEIKCPGEKDHEMALDGKVPLKYYPQLQHQMIVCNLEKCFYFSYRNNSHKLIEVNIDHEYNKMLLEKEKHFFDSLNNLEEPEQEYFHRNDDLWNCACREYLMIKNELEKLSKKEEELKNKLIELSEDKNCIGAGIKTVKYVRKGNVDYQSIPEINNLDLEKYRKKPTLVWKINKL